jgi:hypothetical protein
MNMKVNISIRRFTLIVVLICLLFDVHPQCPSGIACSGGFNNTGTSIARSSITTSYQDIAANSGAVRRFRITGVKLGDVYQFQVPAVTNKNLELSVGYTDNSYIVVRDAGGNNTNETVMYFCYKDGDLTIQVSEDNGSNCQALTANATLRYRFLVDATTPNNWYVHFINIKDRSLDGSYNWRVVYDYGTTLNFNSNVVFTTNTSDPINGGDATKRIASCGSIGADDHTGVAHRTGFPCGRYEIELISVDDDMKLYVNGNEVYNDNNGQAVMEHCLQSCGPAF